LAPASDKNIEFASNVFWLLQVLEFGAPPAMTMIVLQVCGIAAAWRLIKYARQTGTHPLTTACKSNYNRIFGFPVKDWCSPHTVNRVSRQFAAGTFTQGALWTLFSVIGD